MKFWDSSALVPLMTRETRTEELKALAAGDSAASVWWGTEVECASAMDRRARTAAWSPFAEREASARLAVLARGWMVVVPSDDLRERAVRLVRVHRLSSGDALQLAAALAWADGRPEGQAIVVLDHRLADAARLEGFTVLPEDM